MTTIYEAINEVRRAVGAVGKDGWNSQSNYKFRGVEAVVDAVAPALCEHGVLIVPQLISAEYVMVTAGKNRTEMSSVRLKVRFLWIGPEGDFLESSVAGEAFDSGDKATAKAHSVAYRTTLVEVLSIPTNDRDPDKDTYELSGERQPRGGNVAKLSPADAARNELLKLLKDTDRDPSDAADKFAADNNGADIGQSKNARAIKAVTAHFKTMAGRA